MDLSEIIILIALSALSGFGFFLIFKALLGIFYGSTSKKWPIVKGVIIKSDIISEDDGNSGSHAAIIHYNYWINQKSYTGKRIGFSNKGSRFNASSDSGDAFYISNQYPKGDAVEIFYHPKFHSFSVLEPGFSWWSVLVFFIGLLFTFSPLVMFIEK